MSSNNANISTHSIFNNFIQLISNTDPEYIQCRNILIPSLPNRIEDIGDFMCENFPTKYMKKLYKEFKNQNEMNGMIKVAHNMFEEYIRKQLCFKRIKLLRKISSEEKKKQTMNKYDYYELTYKWLCRKFTNFHSIDLKWKNALFCGKPQAGKSAFTFGVALMCLLQGYPCIFIVRNFTQDSEHMKAKIKRFSNQHKNHMQQLGFTDCPSIEIVDASNMTMNITGVDDDGNDILEVHRHHDVKDALKGSSMKMVIALSNGTQIGCINKVMDEIQAEHGEIPHTVMLTDEADAIGYSEVKIPGATRNTSKEYNILSLRSSQHFEISATVWDILIGNKNLNNNNIVVIQAPPTYKGIRDGVQFKSLAHPIEKWNEHKSLYDEDPNLVSVYEELMSTPIFCSQRYNCELDHPVIVMHKTRNQIKHHKMFFNLFKTDEVYKKFWTVIMECDKGIYLYSNTLRNQKIHIDATIAYDSFGNGEFMFGKHIIMPQLLQWLQDNGGAKRFSHIVIKSGLWSGRSRSYVSTNGVWHLTHEYYIGGGNVPTMIQAQRLLHDRPDSIPLIEYAPLKVIEDIKRGDLMQDEQIERLLNIQEKVYTHIQVEEEIWVREKVPRKPLYSGYVNKGFKPKKVLNDDGGWDIEEYKINIENNDILLGANTPQIIEENNVVVVNLLDIKNAKAQQEFYNYILKQIQHRKRVGQWTRATDFYRVDKYGDRQRTSNWFSKYCKKKRGEYLLLKKKSNAFYFMKQL